MSDLKEIKSKQSQVIFFSYSVHFILNRLGSNFVQSQTFQFPGIEKVGSVCTWGEGEGIEKVGSLYLE